MTTRKIKFVGLHAHSVFSMFDGYGYPSEHLDFAYENGLDAHAITEHGHMNSLPYVLEHLKKMRKDGKQFKVVMGSEVYFHPSIEQWRQDVEDYRQLQKDAKKLKKELEKDDDLSEDSLSQNEETVKKRYKGLRHRRHMVLLAQNQTGLSNIYEMITKSNQGDNYYFYPRIDYKMLEEHSEGVVATSACLGGVYAGDYWGNKGEGSEAVLKAMSETTERMLEIFGDRWYAELQWNAIPEQHELNRYVIETASRYNLQLTTAVDTHYPRPEAWKSRELYKRLDHTKIKLHGHEIPSSVEEIGYELYPKNGEQVWADYKRYSEIVGVEYDDDLVMESIERTWYIAHELIEDFYPDNTVRLPNFVVPQGMTAEDRLTELAKKGMFEKFPDIKENKTLQQEVVPRVLEELDVINSRGFAQYFLTMKKIMDRANSMMFSGCGRGSAAGSMVAYLLDITQVNPLRWNLLFSRFLRKDAKDFPDIDVDVSHRLELVDQMVKEWGETTVVPITNWNKLKTKSLIKDLAKYEGLDFEEVNDVTTRMLIEAEPRIKEERGQTAGILDPPANLQEIKRNSPTFKAFLNKYPLFERRIEEMDGMLRSQGRHAGGVVVAEELSRHMPIIRGATPSKPDKERRKRLGISEYILQTPWSEGQAVRHLEPMGFIKFDLLGLKTLIMIQTCAKLILMRELGRKPTFAEIREFYQDKLHPDVIDFEDQKVYENVFHEGKWAGIFQFTESGAQRFCEQVKPRNLIDLATITSIFRPGPLAAGVHESYVEARKGHVHYENDIIKEVASESYGFLVFQEQIALLAHKLGKDLTLDEGNLLRKVLTKKGTGKGSVKEQIYDKFVVGCVEKGFGREFADRWWQKFTYFVSYGFNKSHAVSYATISYQCAYLLTYHPQEWCAAYLDAESEKIEDLKSAINAVKSFGYRVDNVDINQSDETWVPAPDGKTLIQPLTSIKGVGEKAVSEILKNRPFEKIEDFLFCEEMDGRKVHKGVIDKLVKSNSLSALMDERFENKKHFWSVVADNRPKTLKKFNELLEDEELRNQRKFTDDEELEFISSLTGIYPLVKVVNEEALEKLSNARIPALGELPSRPMKKVVCWAVLKSYKVKKTKKSGKKYLECVFIDSTFVETTVRFWSYNDAEDVVFLHRPYLLELSRNDFGFSGRAWRFKVKPLVMK